jgi:hypothetical protein
LLKSIHRRTHLFEIPHAHFDVFDAWADGATQKVDVNAITKDGGGDKEIYWKMASSYLSPNECCKTGDSYLALVFTHGRESVRVVVLTDLNDANSA